MNVEVYASFTAYRKTCDYVQHQKLAVTRKATGVDNLTGVR